MRCPFIATEVGAFSADVLGISEKRMIEIEVKISLADLRADFSKNKHWSYNRRSDYSWDVQWIPNQFYYAVPEELVEPAKKLLVEKGCDRYGIINSTDFTVVKRAGYLHKNLPTSHVKFSLALRMGSELIRFHESWV